MIQTRDCLLLLGGVDIDPALYGQPKHRQTQRPDHNRDYREVAAVRRMQDQGKPVVGICRGAQLLTVLAGGSLWQHTPHHCNNHLVTTKEDRIIPVTSCHHQVMNLEGADEHEVLAWAEMHDHVEDGNGNTAILEKLPEVVWFPKQKWLAIQSHPEWQQPHDAFRRWLDVKMKELLGFTIDF